MALAVMIHEQRLGVDGIYDELIGPGEVVADAGEAESVMAELVAGGLGRRQAADVVSRLTGVPRNRLYRRSL